MPRIETFLRFINLTTTGLLAGSLGFGESVLMPGWQNELSQQKSMRLSPNAAAAFNAIGPVALASSVAISLAGKRGKPARKILDTASSAALAGVLAATMLVTVPINKRLDEQRPVDYPSDDSQVLVKNFARAHAIRTGLGISAFVCAAASSILFSRE